MDGVISPEGGGQTRLGWFKALVLLLAALVVTHSVSFVISGVPGYSGRVRSEVGGAFDPNFRLTHPGYLPVQAVKPGGQLEQAGIRPGDHIRFEHPWDGQRIQIPANETFRLTILRDGQTIPTSFQSGPGKPRVGWRPGSIMAAALGLFMAVAGVVISLRSSARTGVLLGLALVAMANPGTFPIDWENNIVRYFPWPTLLAAVMSLAPVAVFGFALLQRAQTTGRPIPQAWRATFWLYVVLIVADFLNTAVPAIALWPAPVFVPFFGSMLLAWFGSFVALGLLVRAAFETTGQDRTRFGFLAAALGLYFGGTSGTGMIINLTGNDFSLNNPLAVLGHAMAFAGVVVFLYAALRHRVIDLGFAVNRTLVYGVLSTTLLLTFFFLEWGAEQIIPAGMKQTSLLVSAGIALGLFLVFERVRSWVERGVETLFFRQWRLKEAELRRFVRQAAFVTRIETLRASAVAAFGRFTDGAEVALYHRQGDAYVRAEGAIPDLAGTLDPDSPALIRLRAEPEALEDDLPSGAGLILPIVQRNDLTGFFVLGHKPSGEDYRPDERDALSEAAARIGLDLHALRVEALETEGRDQRRRADLLERQMQQALKAGARA